MPVRERLLRQVDAVPVHWTGDTRGTRGAGHAPQRGVDELRRTWLRAVVKANEGEAFGIELELRRFAKRGFDRVDAHLLQVALEDRDHTRMLRALCRVFGFELEVKAPNAGMRALIRAMNHLPEALRFALVLCGEVAGAVLFQVLLERCDLFRDRPEVEARLRHLIGQIAEDEVGHVAYFGARLPPALVLCARALMPWVGASVIGGLPEFAPLAGGRWRLLLRMCSPLPVPEAMAPLARVY